MTAKCAFFVTFYNVYQVNMLDITCQMEKKMNCGTAVACCKDHMRQSLRILNGFSTNALV